MSGDGTHADPSPPENGRAATISAQGPVPRTIRPSGGPLSRRRSTVLRPLRRTGNRPDSPGTRRVDTHEKRRKTSQFGHRLDRPRRLGYGLWIVCNRSPESVACSPFQGTSVAMRLTHGPLRRAGAPRPGSLPPARAATQTSWRSSWLVFAVSKRSTEACHERLQQLGAHTVLLDVRGRLIKSAKIAEGSLAQCPVSPRDVLREPVRIGAHGMVFVHDHPSSGVMRCSRSCGPRRANPRRPAIRFAVRSYGRPAAEAAP